MTTETATTLPGQERQGQVEGFNPLAALAKFARRNPLGLTFGVICIILIAIAILGPYIAPHDPAAGDSPRLIQPTFPDHPFGTDFLFRDQFSRIIVGARNSLGIGFGAVLVATVVGVTLGITSGYLSGWWDLTVTRLVDLMISFPPVVFLILLLTVVAPSFWTMCLSIGLVFSPSTTRVVRSATLSVGSLQFIEAAHSIGSGPGRIMVRHILPNVFSPIIVIASIQIGGAILAEATISFLGLGVSSATNPSWGRMLNESRLYWQSSWWLPVIPGIALSIAVLAFNIFGDALRDTLDPRLRGSG
jgi:peptide/nickel transport system permease protein